MKAIVAFFLLLFFSYSQASHIVGGEITLKRKAANTYTLSLHMYYDGIDGDPQALEEFAYIALFDKATNTLLDTIKLRKTDFIDIPTEKGICAFINFKTNKLIYSTDIQLTAPKYAGSQGFYAAYDRCCRNASIVNIPNAEFAGTLFYSEFPPITTINNSLTFKTPSKTIYGCLNIPQNYDFGATDVDSDVLHYSLEVPLMGSLDFSDPYGWAVASPYANLPFIKGISLSNIIPSSSGIVINSTTGILSFTPTLAGIFAVRVKASEFRLGNYLGQVNRDYQIIISNCLAQNTEPQLKIWDKTSNQYVQTLPSLNFDARKKQCLSFIGLDTVQGQLLTLKATSLNFSDDDNARIIPAKYPTKSKSDTAIFTYCLDSCVFNRSKTYNINFLLTNENNCAFPSSSGMNVKLNNTVKSLKPIITTSLPNPENDTLYINNVLSFTIKATSQDSNWVKLSTKTTSPISVFKKREFQEANGSVAYTAICSDLIAAQYQYTITATDSNCFAQNTDSLVVKINIVDSLFNTKPFIPNVITPNDDGKNDAFVVSELPQNNCAEAFEKIEIYNRWGTKIYSQLDRNIRWEAQNSPDGLYFYVLKYTNKNFKGWIQVLR